MRTYENSRNQAANWYDELLGSLDWLEIPKRNNSSTHVFHQYTLKTHGINRFEMQEFLMEKGVPAMVYYPVPLHLQTAYRDARYKAGDFPVTEALCEQVISLPMHTELTDEQLNHISSSVIEYLNKNSKA